MKRWIVWLGIWLSVSSLLPADDMMIRLISGRKWEELPSHFSDNSYLELEKTFGNFDSIHVSSSGRNELLYKVKYKNYAEVGNITFEFEDNRYSKLSVINQIKPLYFHDGYRKYAVENLAIKIGDADVLLVQGTLFEPYPAPVPLFFSGDWQFRIKPTDAEELLTLNRLFQSDTFVRTAKLGVFILEDHNITKGLKPLGEIREFRPQDLQQLIGIYRDYFGVRVASNEEYWYLAPIEKDNLIIFEKDRKSSHIYNFNSQSSPDTQLKTTGDEKIILSYNAIKVPKIGFRNVNEVRKMDLFLFFNPEKEFLSATSTLFFANPSRFRLLQLHPDLQIRTSVTSESKRMNIIRKDALCYVLSPETDRMTFFYNGTLKSSREDSDLLNATSFFGPDQRIDKFYYISRAQNFYPNPETEFFGCNLKISLPEKVNCLASGTLIESKSVQYRNNFQFSSRGTKGVSLICGNFVKLEKIDSLIPINIFGTKDFPYRRIIPLDEIRHCVDFLVELYGPLDIPEINLIYRRWIQEGGLSNTGFITLNLLDSIVSFTATTRRIIRRDSPVVLTNSRRDYLIHELAHQWWGGLVSWSSYRDEWLTEGMAQLSALLYLEKILPAARFRVIIEKVTRSAVKYSNAGPICYGKRIANIDEYDAFQSIIYNKAALVLMMLRDMLGKEEFGRRVRASLEKFRFQSIHSRPFIDIISQKDPRILRFFENWIYTRRLPEISCKSQTSGTSAEVTIDQDATDFVFPLWIEISTASGSKAHRVLVDQKNQTFRFDAEDLIRRVEVNPRYAPVIIRREERGTP